MSRIRDRAVGLALLGAVLVMLPQAAAAQPVAQQTTDLVLEAITLRHRSAAESLALVYPLLSPRGTVELQPGDNTLVLRDVRRAIDRIMPLLREFDQPAGRVRVRVQVVSAGAAPSRPGPAPELSPRVVARLKELLRYQSYTLLARADFETQEGLDAAYELSNEYRIAFRLGRLLEDRRVRLEGFKVSKKLQDTSEMTPLIHTNLNLDLDKPMILGLARTEASERALMIIVECSEGDMRLTER
jgi:hypothetical protein